MKCDLHIHSNVSDGKHSRDEIIQLAIAREIQCLSFTEHNDYQSSEIITNQHNIQIINGIEFDSFHKRSFHTLCYFPYFDNKIERLIDKYKENVNDRTEILLQKITKQFGINTTITELQNFFGKVNITKRDVIDFLIFHHYAKDYHEASAKYTGKKAISYVPKYSLQLEEIVDIMHNVGGKVFLAHPCGLQYTKEELNNFLDELIEIGLDGIEIINTSKINQEETILYTTIATEKKLLMCGGSDFHDINKHQIGIENENVKKLVKTIFN